MAKISVVGAGNVGATAALYLAQRGTAQVQLIDIVEGMPQGKALDMLEASPIYGLDSMPVGSNNFDDVRDSDVVVITAGFPRQPGMDRLDLLKKNADIMSMVAERVGRLAPKAVVLVVTNPLDVMAWLCWKTTGFPHNRVLGMAGVLDSARLRAFVAVEMGVSVKDVDAMVLGGHGDSMVPLPRYTTVNGVPITELLPAPVVDKLVARTRKAGGEIVSLLKTGSAYYSPAASVVEMVDAVLRDENRILPCAAYLSGQYGMRDIYLGVPVKLGAGGAKEILELKLTSKELVELQRSGKEVQEAIASLNQVLQKA